MEKLTRLKAFGIILAVWALQYFVFSYIQHFRDSATLPLTALDKWIPVWSPALIVYATYFVFVFVPFFLIKDSKTLKKAVVTFLFGLVAAWAFFAIYPVLMIRPIEVFQPQGFFDSVLVWMWGFDKYFNVFPSEHVIGSWITALILTKVFRKWAFVPILIATAISLSTLLVKQHYIWDVLAGFVIACGAYYFGFLKEKWYNSSR